MSRLTALARTVLGLLLVTILMPIGDPEVSRPELSAARGEETCPGGGP